MLSGEYGTLRPFYKRGKENELNRRENDEYLYFELI
jgi:hypothetical protein